MVHELQVNHFSRHIFLIAKMKYSSNAYLNVNVI